MYGLNSPFIVCYIDSFAADCMLNIILEFCPSGDLATLVAKQKKLKKPTLNENTIWKIFIQICLGVQYLHSRQIIHRDLKCLNVFMLKDNQAKIGDFGCAQNLT